MAVKNSFLKHLNIWVFGVGSKLVPCVLLTYLSFSLINVLIEADKRKRRLQAGNQRKPQIIPNSTNKQQPSQSSNGTLEVTHITHIDKPLTSTLSEIAVDMNHLDNSLTNLSPNQNLTNQTKCLFDKSKTATTDLNIESNSEQPTLSTNQSNFDCNNNNRQNANQISLADNEQPLSIHSSKEHVNYLTNNCSNHNKKRLSTCSITKQFNLVIKSKSNNLKKNKNDKSTPALIAGTPTAGQSSNVYLATTQSSQQNDRTTKMLLAVLLIFLLTEFPSGLLILLSSIMGKFAELSVIFTDRLSYDSNLNFNVIYLIITGENFFVEIYLPLGNILDLLALVNSSVS